MKPINGHNPQIGLSKEKARQRYQERNAKIDARLQLPQNRWLQLIGEIAETATNEIHFKLASNEITTSEAEMYLSHVDTLFKGERKQTIIALEALKRFVYPKIESETILLSLEMLTPAVI